MTDDTAGEQQRQVRVAWTNRGGPAQDDLETVIKSLPPLDAWLVVGETAGDLEVIGVHEGRVIRVHRAGQEFTTTYGGVVESVVVVDNIERREGRDVSTREREWTIGAAGRAYAVTTSWKDTNNVGWGDDADVELRCQRFGLEIGRRQV